MIGDSPPEPKRSPNRIEFGTRNHPHIVLPHQVKRFQDVPIDDQINVYGEDTIMFGCSEPAASYPSLVKTPLGVSLNLNDSCLDRTVLRRDVLSYLDTLGRRGLVETKHDFIRINIVACRQTATQKVMFVFDWHHDAEWQSRFPWHLAS
jgi:hypothetical protein